MTLIPSGERCLEQETTAWPCDLLWKETMPMQFVGNHPGRFGENGGLGED